MVRSEPLNFGLRWEQALQQMWVQPTAIEKSSRPRMHLTIWWPSDGPTASEFGRNVDTRSIERRRCKLSMIARLEFACAWISVKCLCTDTSRAVLRREINSARLMPQQRDVLSCCFLCRQPLAIGSVVNHSATSAGVALLRFRSARRFQLVSQSLGLSYDVGHRVKSARNSFNDAFGWRRWTRFADRLCFAH